MARRLGRKSRGIRMKQSIEFWEAEKIVKDITLIGGSVGVMHSRLGADLLPLIFMISVKDRKDGKTLTVVEVNQTIHLKTIYSVEELLGNIQAIWTSLWMHESLETFRYKGGIPFDPHCKERLQPRHIGFFVDNECTAPYGADLYQNTLPKPFNELGLKR